MNLKGEYEGIKWIGFDRERAGRRRERILKYSLAAGEWRPIVAPKEITSDSKFRAWALGELERIRASGEAPKRQRGGSTVEDLFERYLEVRKADPDVSGATYRDNKSDFNARILPRWRAVPVLALDGMRQELRAWVRELAGQLSPSRCRNVVSTFRGFVGICMMEGWVPLRSNPLDSREVLTILPNLPQKRDVVTLPRELGQALLDDERIDLRRAVRYSVALNTGAADGELAGARVADVLTLNGPIARLEIKGALKLRPKDPEQGAFVRGKPKNDFRRRAIPLNACARAALKVWLEEGWEHWVGRQPEPTDPLFPSAQGAFSRPDSADWLRRDLALLKLPEADTEGRPYEFRALRRTFSTLLRAAKVDRELREQLMGQRSDSVNTEHYTAEVPEELLEAVERLPFVWRRRGLVVTGDTGSDPSESPENLVADPETAVSATTAPGDDTTNLRDKPHVPAAPETRVAFVNRRSRVQIPKLAPALFSAPPSAATTAPPRETDRDDEEDLAIALAEHSSRADVAELLALPLANPDGPAPEPEPESKQVSAGGRS